MPAGTAVEAPLEVHEVPEQQVVMARVEGPFTLIVGAHAGIEEFVAAEGPVPAERHGLDDPIERLGFNRSLSDPQPDRTGGPAHRGVRAARLNRTQGRP